MDLCPFIDINGNDVIQLIMKYLTVKDVLFLGATCTKMKAMSESENLWAYLLYRDYGVNKHPIMDKNSSSKEVYSQEKDYKIIYNEKNIDLALCWCCLELSMDGAKYYLRRGANVNGKVQESPLMIAATEGYAQLVDLLLLMGADPNFIDSKNETALIRCGRRGVVKIAKLLLNAGADINKVGNNGTSIDCAER